jgi:hypothetical protein
MEWKSDSNAGIQYLPLRYSLYDTNGDSIRGGIKWEFNDLISEDKSNDDTFVVDQYYSVTQYYLTINELQRLLIYDVDDIQDAKGPEWIKAVKYFMDGAAFVDAAFIPEIVTKTMGFVIWILEGNDYINKLFRDGTLNSLEELLRAAEKEKVVLVLQGERRSVTQKVFITPNLGSALHGPDIQFQVATTSKTYVSMKYSDNIAFVNKLDGTNFGRISYIDDTVEMKGMIKRYIEAAYPILLPWNW